MPKIQISEKLFYSLLQDEPSYESLEKKLVCAKAEIDEPADADGVLKIELNDTNRPDLWTVAGLARQLRCYYSGLQSLASPKKPATKTAKNTTASKITAPEIEYKFFSEDADAHKHIIVDKNMRAIRPYVLGFIVSGKTVDAALLTELIQMQEKLCENFGQKRKSVAIGIYREALIQWPVHYVAADPRQTAFVPLDYTKELSLQEILKEHPKGKEYAHLIQDAPRFPLLVDSADKVLSMPPVINSAYVGAVQEGDETLFIECTGDNMEQLMLATNIFACDCQELGFKITRIESRFSYKIEEAFLAKGTGGTFGDRSSVQSGTDKTSAAKMKDKFASAHSPKPQLTDTASSYTVSAPLYFQGTQEISMVDAYKLLGEALSEVEVLEALARMNVSARVIEGIIEIEVPPYRNDFLHGVDIVEDIMIGRGMENFEAQHPVSFTIGRVSDLEMASRRVAQVMVGLGFQEMIFPYLGSRVDFIERMYAPQDWDTVQASMVQVSNPISENYEFVRASILPSLLSVEKVSAHSPYPHNIFELGKVACIDAHDNLGARTDTVMGFLMADTEIGFTDVHAIISAICYYNDIEWALVSVQDSRLIEGRACLISRKVGGKNVPLGMFGEVHPRVLQAYGVSMPCVCGEIIVDAIL